MRFPSNLEINRWSDFVVYWEDYLLVILWFGFSFFLTFLLFLISVVFVPRNRDEEKLSSYECGFQPFEDTRQKFDIKYYLVAILFIVFDLEIMFIVPWVKVWSYVGIYGLFVLFIFLIVLTIGFIYEIKKEVLKWN